MSHKEVLGPLLLGPEDAAIAAAVIAERTEGFDLRRTPFASLHAFGHKLSKALKRRRKSGTKIAMWTVKREEAEAGFEYLFLFSHEDVPEGFLSMKEMDAVHNTALDILSVLIAKRGAQSLHVDEMERRIRAWADPEISDVHLSDEKWIRRLKRRLARERAFWKQAEGYRREPIPPSVMKLLAPPNRPAARK